MFRRARLSVKPNVRPSAAGRVSGGESAVVPAAALEARHGPETTARSAEATPESQPGTAQDLQQDRSGGDGGGGSSGGSGSSSRDQKSNNPNGDGDCSKHTDTPLQRRRRISTMPSLVKPRAVPPSARCAINSVSKCSQKQVPHSPIPSNPPLQKEPSASEINIEKSPTLPEQKIPLPQAPQFSPFKNSINKETSVSVTAPKSDESQLNNISSPLKERPTQETLIQEEIQQSKPDAPKEKNICSDHGKIIKAKKLRQLLKEELKKEKQQRKYRCPVTENHMPDDRSKMIMRDFIYYLPESNPMKSSLVEEKKLEKTLAQAKEPEATIVANNEDESEDSEEEEEEEEEEEKEENDGPLLVPRVKVAEDGSIILDEESLTVEVLRTKGQCVVEENDPIFERGSTTTYSSFRKSYYTKPWSEKETDMFFLAISMVGTDFSMISQLFPHRARTEIKNKFKREEKANGWRVDKAFKEKRPFDFDLFAKLLEKVLETERRKKANDAKCQPRKEQTANEKKVPKSQKKQKAKVTSGQPSVGQDDQNARISDTEMEVDCGTAEKENEESLSILEHNEGQTVTESVAMKKKRKKKKKDSKQETETPSEGKPIPSQAGEAEKQRKEGESISSSIESHGTDETSEEMQVPDGQAVEETFGPVEEDAQCCLQLNKGTDGEDNLNSPCIQEGASIQDESEVQVSEASSENIFGQQSKSPIPSSASKEGFEGTHAEAVTILNEVAGLDKLDGRLSVQPSHDNKTETKETESAATKNHTIKGQEQSIKLNLTRTSEKNEIPINALEVQLSFLKPAGGIEKTIVEDKADKITGSTTEKLNERSNSDVGRESQVSHKASEEKTETRRHHQRPKPNIIKASCRKEAPIQGKSGNRMFCPEPDGTVRKDSDQDGAAEATAGETTGKDCQVLAAESLAYEKSTLEENNRPIILRPALLARRRMQKPKPNLGMIAKRQAESPSDSETLEEKAIEATVETKKTLIPHECSSSYNLTEQASEATNFEADVTHSQALENKAVATSDKMDLIHSNQPSFKKPLENVNFEIKSSLSSDSVKNVLEPVCGESHLQEVQKETAAEIQHCLESLSETLTENLGEAAERQETLGPEKEMHEDNLVTGNTEKKTVHLSSVCDKLSGLGEGAKCGILPSSHLSEEHSTDAEEAVATHTTHLSPSVFSTLDSGDKNQVSLSGDSQEKSSDGKQSSQEEGKQKSSRPMPLLRGRLQRPKPNIGRAVGRKEIQSAEKNEEMAAFLGNEKSKLQKPEPTRDSSIATQLTLDKRGLSAKASEDRELNCEKMVQEGSQVPGCSQNIPDHCTIEKNLPPEDKPGTIKPAQLMRGRFQRARPNLGRLNGKKKEPMSENVRAPFEQEKGKAETENLRKDDLHPPSKDEASMSDLEKKNQLEFSEPERCIDLKEVSPPVQLSSCEFLKDQVERNESEDAEEKQLHTLPSDVSAPREISPSRSIKPTEPRRGLLQRPRLNVARADKKKDVSSGGERGTENKCGREREDLLCGEKKPSSLMHDSGEQVETTSSSEFWGQKNCANNIKPGDSKRSKHPEICDSLDQTLGDESQIRKEVSNSLPVQERAPETLKRKQPERTLKQRKPICDSRSTYSAFECETDHSEKGKRLQKVKPNVSRGRRLKPALGKKPRKEYGSSKINLVTLRASSQEEEDDDDTDDFEPDCEAECFSPEEVNKAPVFVPKGLRSPNPVPVQIEETMEELEIYENIPEEVCIATAQCLFHGKNIDAESVLQGDEEPSSSQLVTTQERPEKNKGLNDGSTEAAMTLLAMRDPVFQLNISTQENASQYTAENLKSELVQNIRLDVLPKRSFTDKHEIARFSHATQKNNIERKDLVRETSEITLVSTVPEHALKTETWPSELPDYTNTNIKNVQLSEKDSGPVEYLLSTEVAQADECKPSGSSAITEMTTVSPVVKECPEAEEEQTFILTLVEISADSEDCSGASTSLQQDSEELFQAPVALVELTRENSTGSIKATAEENTVSFYNVTEIRELQTTSGEKPVEYNSTSLRDRKRHALGFEESGDPPEKKKPYIGESLKCSNKEIALKPCPIAKKTSAKVSGKLNISTKQNSAASKSVSEGTETHMEEKEMPKSSMRLLMVEPPNANEQASRTVCSGKAETSEEQRSFVDIYKPLKSGHSRSTAVPPKRSSSRPFQRPLGFLPLICKKTNTEEVTFRGSKQSLKKPHIDVSKTTLECPTLSSRKNKEDIQGNSLVSSAALGSSKCENASSSAVQVCSDLIKNESSLKEQEKVEEPTTISEYFFRDIFMEVDDSE